jgi:hypothetical protein
MIAYWALLLGLSPGLFSTWAQTSKAVIEGTVVNAATGAPISGARLNLMAVNEELKQHPDIEPAFTKTDSGGRFRFGNAGRALFTLRAEYPGAFSLGERGYFPAAFLDFRVSPKPLPFSFPKSPEVEISTTADRDGTPRAKISIKLSFYAVIEGKVTSPDGLAMQGCVMEMFREVPPGLSERETRFAEPIPGTGKQVLRMSGLTLITNDIGEYHATRLKPGSYYVKEKCMFSQSIWEPGDWETFYPSAIGIDSAKAIKVAAGDHVRADIRISAAKGVKVSGRLSGAEKARVSIKSTDNTSFRLIPPVSGKESYEFENVAPGKYQLTALSSDRTAGALREVAVGDRNLESADLTLQPLPDLAGTVVFREGCKPGPVVIEARADFGKVGVSTDVNGHFVLRHMLPGRFYVFVNPSDNYSRVDRMQLGDRTLTSEWFEPAKESESLRIEMTCPDARRQQ